jgi:hypothetical protein
VARLARVHAQLVVVFLLGLYLVHEGHWGWGHFWIVYSLAAFALSFLIGAGFLGPSRGGCRR